MNNGQPRFPLGQIVATPGALDALKESDQSPAMLLARHAEADWGEELCAEDRKLNDQALIDGSRILSAYRTAKNTKLWIITEAADDTGHRAATTILRPEDY